MTIILRLDRVMADRKISLNELAEKVGISNVNLSNIKTGKYHTPSSEYPKHPANKVCTSCSSDILL